MLVFYIYNYCNCNPMEFPLYVFVEKGFKSFFLSQSQRIFIIVAINGTCSQIYIISCLVTWCIESSTCSKSCPVFTLLCIRSLCEVKMGMWERRSRKTFLCTTWTAGTLSFAGFGSVSSGNWIYCWCTKLCEERCCEGQFHCKNKYVL